jgi:serine/threonine protein kinase
MLRTTNNYYLVYEYCNGGTLSEYIKAKKRLTEDEAVKIFLQIRSAFETLSAENILHRDLKPTNILFHNGVIKVADFGFCKELMKDTDMTQTMVGSPIYMAPEVLKGLIYDSRADIWSMGVILYEMLYGICPYEESSIPKLVTLIDNTMLKFNPAIKVSENIKNLIKRTLTIKYRDRISPVELIKYPIDGDFSLNNASNAENLHFKEVCKFVRKNILYLAESIELLISYSEDLLYLRLCYLTYKIMSSFMKETNKGSSYWEMLKIQNSEEKWEYIYENEGNALKPFAEQLREALVKTDSETVETKI